MNKSYTLLIGLAITHCMTSSTSGVIQRTDSWHENEENNELFEKACWYTEATEQLLKTNGFHIDSRDKNGKSILHHAANRSDFSNVLLLLLEKGANTNLIDQETTWSPLHYSASRGNAESIKKLLDFGAERNVLNRDNQTALDIAKDKLKKEKNDTIWLKKYAETCQVLENYEPSSGKIRGNIDSSDASEKKMETVKIYKKVVSRVELVKEVLDIKGYHIDGINKIIGKTLLHLAAETGSAEVLRYLLENRASVNKTDRNNSWSALHYCAQQGNVGKIKLMLDFGADRTLKGNDGETALDIAKRNNHTEACKILENYWPSSQNHSFKRIIATNWYTIFAVGIILYSSYLHQKNTQLPAIY